MVETKTKKTFTLYFAFVVISVLLFNMSGRGSAVMYAGYFASIMFLFFSFLPMMKHIDLSTLAFGSILSFFGFLSFVTHNEHAFDSVRSAALNINILIPFLYFSVIGVLKTHKTSIGTIEDVLQNYVYITLIVGTLTLIFNVNSLGQIFALSSNAYNVALKGFFPNKNMFGNFVAIGAVISIYLFSSNRKRVNLLAMIVLVFLTIISFCRAALLFLFAFSLFYFLSASFIPSVNEKKKIRRIRAIVIIAIVSFVILWICVPAINTFVLNKVIRSDVSDAGRTGIHNKAQLLMKNGGLVENLIGYGPSELEYSLSMDVHSTYYNLLLTGGIVKMVLFSYGLIISMLHIRRIKKNLISSFCLSCLFSYVVFSMFETVVYFELGFLSFEILFLIIIIPLSIDADSVVEKSTITN